jgi:aminotransferase
MFDVRDANRFELQICSTGVAESLSNVNVSSFSVPFRVSACSSSDLSPLFFPLSPLSLSPAMPFIKPTVSNARPILIKQIAAETSALVAGGAQILSLAQGTPNLPLFPEASAAMVRLIEGGSLPYTDVAGLMSVRDTCARFVRERYTLPAHASADSLTGANVMITAGAAQAVYNSLALSVGSSPSDVVLSPLPAYGLYAHQCNILGAKFVAIETTLARGFKPTPEDIANAFAKQVEKNAADGTEKCNVRSLVLCYPNNPTGSLLSEAEARALAEALDAVLERHYPADGSQDFSLVLDEVYIGIAEAGKHHSVLSYASPRLLRNSLLILSASKGLGAMPGARAGFLTAFDPTLIPELTKLQMAVTANASSVGQIGLQASLEHVLTSPQALQRVHEYYRERTNFCVDRLNAIANKYFNTPDGAAAAAAAASPIVVARHPTSTFYVLADFSRCWPGLKTDREVQELLRDQYRLSPKQVGVACVPGCAFALRPEDKLVRFSCAVEMPVLVAAMDVVEEAVRAHMAGLGAAPAAPAAAAPTATAPAAQ